MTGIKKYSIKQLLLFELKLILRNKRTIPALIFYFTYFFLAILFSLIIKKDGLSLLFIFLSGCAFATLYSPYIFNFGNRDFGGLINEKIDFQTLLKVKVIFLQLTIVLCSIINLPLILKSLENYLLVSLISSELFMISIFPYITLIIACFSNVQEKLTKNRDFEEFKFSHFILIVFPILLISSVLLIEENSEKIISLPVILLGILSVINFFSPRFG